MTRCLSTLGFLLFVACVDVASAQTLEELRNDGKNTDNVLTYGMGYNLNRYSALNQVNRTTVKRLVPVWNLSLDNRWGEQAQPLLYNGVMYVTNAKWTVAIDAATGKQLWRTEVDWLPETPRVVCCGTRVRPSTTARCSAPRWTRSWSRSTRRRVSSSGSRRPPTGARAIR